MTLFEWWNSRTCCCPHPDAKACLEERYGEPILDPDERCDCCCHNPDEDEADRETEMGA
jgi:hypothetical protein